MGQTVRATHKSPEKVEIRANIIQGKATQLKRSLGCFDAFIFVVSTIIGVGIYVSPGLVARYTDNMGTSLIIWVISGIVCLLGALCFCELAVAFRKTGNRYIFIKEAYGNLAAFCAIWAQFFIASPTCIATISVAIGDHVVGMFVETSSVEGQWLVRCVAVSCTIGSFVVNCISISFSAKAQTVFGAVQIIGMILFICIGIWNMSTGETENFRTMFQSTGNGSLDFNRLSLAFVSALWSYDGWGEIVSINEELNDMKRNLRLGFLTGMPFVILCYVMFNIAIMTMLTHAEMGLSITVATKFIKKSIGARYAVVVPIIVALSCFGSLNSTIMTGSRSILSAAREGHLPLPLSYIHKERCTPIPALICILLFSILWIMVFGSKLVTILIYFSLGIWLTYGAALFAVIVLRIRRPDLERPYKVWLIYPILTTIISCYIIVAPFFEHPIECAICLCILLTAIPVYYLVLYCMPDSVNTRKSLLYRWILDHFPLAECVFEMTVSETTPLMAESNM